MSPDQPMIGSTTQASMLKIADSIIGNSDIAVCRASSFCLLAHTTGNSIGRIQPPLCKPEAFLGAIIIRKRKGAEHRVGVPLLETLCLYRWGTWTRTKNG